MNEPVAWRVKNTGGMNWQLLCWEPKGHYDFIEPLYTSERLHPLVKWGSNMTFDEAVREYQLRSSIGPLVQEIQLSPFVNVPQQEYDRVKFLNNLFYETINKLRKEYAQPVKMTRDELNELNQLLGREDYASLAVLDIERQSKLYPNLNNMLFTGSLSERVESENKLNYLWANYDPERPEETIEIVTNN